jgi:hypothetical protein
VGRRGCGHKRSAFTPLPQVQVVISAVSRIRVPPWKPKPIEIQAAIVEGGSTREPRIQPRLRNETSRGRGCLNFSHGTVVRLRRDPIPLELPETGLMAFGLVADGLGLASNAHVLYSFGRFGPSYDSHMKEGR